MQNRLAKSISVILFSLSFAIVGTARADCDWQLKTAPLLLNLQIGSSPEQIRAIFGKALKVKIKKKGARTFFQNYIKRPAPAPLGGVRALYLRFFDYRLYQIEIFYEPRRDLQTLETIKNALSSELDLPAPDWQTKNNRARIKCGEISLVADNILNPRVELTDETVRLQVEAAREKDDK